MTILRKDLQALNRDIKALEKKMGKLIAAVEKSEKAKTTKRVPAKKAPVTRKTAPPTATDQVLNIIKRSKKGVNAATLMTKTGFDLKKVRNILQRTYKQGKIKRLEKGVYVGDILRCVRLNTKEVLIGAIKLNPGGFVLYNPNCCDRCRNSDGCFGDINDWFHWPNTWKIEIIGNIHQDKKLLDIPK